jgi:Skp family chaperone for outer membrane proteins
MIKKVLLFAFIIFTYNSFAQKAQRIGYIDMEYILENIPEYNEAQSKINAKSNTWQSTIEKQQKEIDALIADLNNEKALLTKELIIEKEEDIQIKELDLKNLKNAYYGTSGDLYFLRQQLVKPIQDLVYNAIQDIAKNIKYDFVIDNSSSLVMLYSNNQYDISDLVISSINRLKKLDERTSKSKQSDDKPTIVNEELQKNIDIKERKRLELQKKIEDKRAAQLKKREELKKAIEAKRQKRIKEIEDAKKAKEEQTKQE